LSSTSPPESSAEPESSTNQAFDSQGRRPNIRWSSTQHINYTESYDGVGPSPSVEPPLISVYKLGPSPSPAYWAPDYQPYTVQYQTDGSSLPPSHAIRVDSLPLEDITEMGSSLGHRDGQQAGVGSSPPESHSSVQTVAPTAQKKMSLSRTLRRKPVLNTMHPDGSKITPQIGYMKPPDEAINHAETIRHGSAFHIVSEVSSSVDADGQSAEVGYQAAITPPVARREPPPAIVLDPNLLRREEPLGPNTSPVEGDDEVNTMTWSSNPNPSSSLAPPVPQDPMRSPNIAHRTALMQGHNSESEVKASAHMAPSGPYDITKPTCSLNLVCYRSGAKGCDLQQVQCILRSKFPDSSAFQNTVDANPILVHTDQQFFREMRKLFDGHMSSFTRRWLSLKTHKAFRILAYTPTTRPVVVPFDDFVLQEMMFAYLNPDKVESTDDWIQWVFRLRRREKRHAVEFVEGWNSTRIAIAGSIPWLSSCIVGIAWTAAGGNVQSAFTVASFILTSASIILALLAIVSSIESSGRTVM